MIDVTSQTKTNFKSDLMPKYIKIHFPNGEYRDLSNNDLIAESFVLNESLCSSNKFKFGLCEANHVSFKVLNVDKYLKGAKIKISIKAGTSDSIPLGVFIIDSCKKEAGTPLRNITAYSPDYILAPKKEDVRLYKRFVNQELYAEMAIYPICYGKAKAPITWNDAGFNTIQIEYNLTTIQGDAFEETTSGTLKKVHHDADIRVRLTVKQPLNTGLQMYYTEAEQIDVFDYISNIRKQAEDFWLANLTEDIEVYEKVTNEGLKKIVNSVFTENNEAHASDNTRVYDEKYHYTNTYYIPITDLGFWMPIKTQIIVNDLDGYGQRHITTWGEEKSTKNDSAKILVADKSDFLHCKIPYKIFESTSEYKKYCEALFELDAKFGRYSRNGVFELVSIDSNFARYCSEALQCSREITCSSEPSRNTYIVDTNAQNGAYWEDYIVDNIGTVYFDYLDQEEEEVITSSYTFDVNGDNAYYIQSNPFLTEYTRTYQEVVNLLNARFIPNIHQITWRPMNVKCQGVPYVEAGDVIRVVDGGAYRDTFVHSRTLSGIHMLIDTFTSDVSEFDETNLLD